MPILSDLETARLNALSSYDILDSLPEEDYDAITRIASQICGMPVSTITLIDEQRQWFKSMVGLTNRQTPREYAFCDHAIRTPDQLMEVEDARADSRFVSNPLTTGDPHVVFYAGIPMVDEDGHALGALCVIDHKPNKLTEPQKDLLKLLARQVVTLLTLRRNRHLLETANEQLQTLNQQLQQSNQTLQAVVDNCPAGLVLWQAIREEGTIIDFRYELTNAFNATVTGLSVEQMTGNTLKTLFPHVGVSDVVERLITTVETGQRQHYQQYNSFDQLDMWGDYVMVPFGDQVLVMYQDIGLIKKNEEQLRAYSENLEQLVSERTAEISQLSALQNAILEYAGSAIISTNTEGLIQTVNPATLHLLGYDRAELVDRREVSTLYDPACLAKRARGLGDRLGQVVAADFSLFRLIKNDRSYECTMLHKNGRLIPVLLITTPLRAPDDTVIGYVMMVTDITPLKNTRAELQRKNQELNTFFDVALDLHCIATTDGTILKTNRAWQTTLGYTEDELMGMNHFDLVHSNDREATRTVVGMATPYHKYMSHVNRFRRKDGVYRLIEWNVVAIDNILYASSRDITERHQAEKELKKLNQRLKLATQAAGQGIWEYDLEQDLLLWDQRMFDIHGLDYREIPLQARDYLELMHPEDQVLLDAKRNPKSGKVVNYTLQIRIFRPDGVMRHTELHGINLFNKAGKRTGSVGITWDITERKLAEQELKKANQRLQLATQAAKQGIWDYDAIHNLLHWDEQMCRIHGLPYTGNPLRLEDYIQRIHPEDLPAYQQNRQRELADVFVNERRIIRPDGTIRYTELHRVWLTTNDGQQAGSVGVVQDITERKLADITLRQSEERYRSLVGNLKEVVFQANPQGEWTFLNPYWTTMTGYSVDEALGHIFYEYIPAQDQPRCRLLYREFTASRKASSRFIIRYQHQDGSSRWAEAFAQVLFDEQGQITGTTGTITDITERKKALDALRQSEQRFRDIAEVINEIFWIHSAQPLQLLYINPAYEHVTGLSSAPLYTDPLAFLDMVLPEDRHILGAAFERYAQGQEINVQYRARNRQGDIRWFDIHTFVKKDSHGQPLNYVGVATDITNQKERELVLQQSLEKEQSLNRLKSQFVSTASHEFRTPLATIQSSVDLIKLYTGQPSPKTQGAVERHLGVIEKEIVNFSNLLADILTFGKIDAGKVPFSPRPTDMVGLVNVLINTHFGERIDKRMAQVSITGTPRLIYADGKLLSHALINLLSNAFKFSGDDPALTLNFEAGQFRIIVSDTGIGIPADEQVHLFDTFFRARNAVNVQGSGLGLVIASQFVEQHGGQLDIYSQENVGTTCTITLPG